VWWACLLHVAVGVVDPSRHLRAMFFAVILFAVILFALLHCAVGVVDLSKGLWCCVR